MSSNPRLVEALDDANSGGECRRNNAVLNQTCRQLVFYNHSRTIAIKQKPTHYSARPLSSTSMAEIGSIYDGPSELVDCIKDHCSHYTLPSCGILKLLFDGRDGKSGYDYTWGFRIYRTTYCHPNSDSRFAKALEVLNEYLRFACFSCVEKRHKDAPPADGKANEQLWKHLRNEIIEDRELLEGASSDPAKILELAQNWVHHDCKAQTRDSPRYRFCLVIDDEVIDHLLHLPLPPSKEKDIPGIYSVKVFDIRHDSDFSCSETSDDDESDRESIPGIEDFFDGCFWSPVHYLPQLWFCDYQEDIFHPDYSWDGKLRFIPGMVAIQYGLPCQ
jgi:hypothetical protein